MTDEKRDNLIRKIKNLLKLAENEGATPAEAAAAMGRAQHLMDRYKIDAALAEAFDDEPTEEIRDWDDPLDTMTGRSLPTWLGRLAMVVAGANGCHVYQSRGEGGRKMLKILGGASDATTARYLYKWIRRQVDEMACEYSGNGKTWINNWRLGVVQEINYRMKRARKAAAADAVREGHALIVVETALAKIAQRSTEVEAWGAANLGLRGRGRSTSSRYDSSARAQGRQDGRSVTLNGGGRRQLS